MFTTPPGTSEVASTSESVIAGRGRWYDEVSTHVFPVTMIGASTLTSPRSEDFWGARAATTPVGSGREKFFNFSLPEPTGVVAALAPQKSSLLGLVSVLAPIIVTGNTCVLTSSYQRPLPAITLSEVLGTSDVPGGVVNILTGQVGDTAPWLASHMDVNAIDLTGAAGDVGHAVQLEEAAAENLKRVLRPADAEPDWRADPGTERLTTFLETKTVWPTRSTSSTRPARSAATRSPVT